MAQDADSELDARITSLRKLTELNPNNEEYLRAYAEALIQMGRYMRADHVLGRLHKLLIRMDKQHEADDIMNLRHTALKSSHAVAINEFLQHAAQRASLLNKPKRLQVGEGEYLFRQGDQGSDVFLICDGELSVWKHFDENNQPTLINTLKAGDVAGDIAYFYDNQRSADLLANQTCRLLRFSQKQLAHLLLAQPDIETLWRQLAEMRYRMLQLSTNPMLASLPENMRAFIAEHSENVSFKAFSVVAEEGKPIQSIDLVVSGSLRRIVEGHSGNSHIFTSVQPGQLVGWEASMHGHTGFSSDTNLTALMTVDTCTLMRIPMAIFQEVLDMHPPLRTAVAKNIHHYVSETLATLRSIE